MVRAQDSLLKRSHAFHARIRFVSDLNRNVPVCESRTLSIRENSPVGTTVGHLVGKDGDNGFNGLLTYHLVTNNDSFAVDAFSGQVSNYLNELHITDLL